MDSGGQGWTGVWSQFGHGLVIFVGERFAVDFVGVCLPRIARSLLDILP